MWIIWVFLMTHAIGQSIGCTCMPDHIQNHYCSSSLVIRGKARKYYYDHEGQNPETTTFPPWNPNYWRREMYFKVEVIDVFKAPPQTNIKAGDVIEAITNVDQGLCGGWLNLDVDLLIMGSWGDNQQMGFSSCSYKKPFHELTQFQKETIRGSFACECKVWTGYRSWYEHLDGNERGCSLNVFPGYDTNCLHNFGQCVIGKDNNCVWEVENNASCTFIN